MTEILEVGQATPGYGCGLTEPKGCKMTMPTTRQITAVLLVLTLSWSFGGAVLASGDSPAPPAKHDDHHPAPPAKHGDHHPAPPAKHGDHHPAPPAKHGDHHPAPAAKHGDHHPAPAAKHGDHHPAPAAKHGDHHPAPAAKHDDHADLTKAMEEPVGRHHNAHTDYTAAFESHGQEAEHEEGPARVSELFLMGVPDPQSTNELQMTYGVSYMDNNDEDELELSFAAEYGITDWFQVGVEVPFAFLFIEDHDDESGIGDIELAMMFNLMNQDAPFMTSVAVGFTLPTGDEHRDLGDGTFAVTPELLVSKQLDQLALYGSAGVTFNDSSEEEFVYGLGATYNFGPFFGIIELTGSSGEEEEPVFITPGVSFELFEGLEVNLGAPIGLNEDAEDWGVVALFTIEFGLGG